MATYIVEVYDFDWAENSMTGPVWNCTVEGLSPLDAVIKAARYADTDITKLECCDDEMIASAYALEDGTFEFHLYINGTDTAFTMPEDSYHSDATLAKSFAEYLGVRIFLDVTAHETENSSFKVMFFCNHETDKDEIEEAESIFKRVNALNYYRLSETEITFDVIEVR